MRRVIGTLGLMSMLVAGLTGPVAAAPADPYVSQLVGTVHWVTDSVPPYTSWYVFDVTLFAKNVKPQYTMCVKVTWPGLDPVAESGYAFPRVRPGGETSLRLQFGAIPDGAASVTVTAQLMRLGARHCCVPVGTMRTVSAPLPSPRPPLGSQPIVVFDEGYEMP